MPAREILLLGNPTLMQTSAEITDPAAPETQTLVRDLDHTLAAFRAERGFGRGIAAPQIGRLQRVISVRMFDESFAGPLINPAIAARSDNTIEMWDSCFSFPDLLVRVSRASEITVNYTDQHGQSQTLDADSDLAELLQHEIDHLDGILAVHRAITPAAFMTRDEWERQGRPQ